MYDAIAFAINHQKHPEPSQCHKGTDKPSSKPIAGSRDLSAESFSLTDCTSLYCMEHRCILLADDRFLAIFDKVLSNMSICFFGMFGNRPFYHMDGSRTLFIIIHPTSRDVSKKAMPGSLTNLYMAKVEQPVTHWRPKSTPVRTWTPWELSIILMILKPGTLSWIGDASAMCGRTWRDTIMGAWEKEPLARKVWQLIDIFAWSYLSP